MSAKAQISVTRLHYHKQRRLLDIQFSNGVEASLTAEFLRVFSPSAEVQGHGNVKLVSHKKQVGISKLTPVGHYAVKLHFDDGHDSGIYSWSYLYQLQQQQSALWQDYLNRLRAANAQREQQIAVTFKP